MTAASTSAWAADPSTTDVRAPLISLFPSSPVETTHSTTWHIQLDKQFDEQALTTQTGTRFTEKPASLKGTLGLAIRKSERLDFGIQIPLAMLYFDYAGGWLTAQYHLVRWNSGRISVGATAGYPLTGAAHLVIAQRLLKNGRFMLTPWVSMQARYVHRSIQQTDFTAGFPNGSGGTDYPTNDVAVAELSYLPAAGIRVSTGNFALTVGAGLEKIGSTSIRSEQHRGSDYFHKEGAFAMIGLSCTLSCFFEGMITEFEKEAAQYEDENTESD